jgi:predicted nucleotidyltransferase component of viral defense system
MQIDLKNWVGLASQGQSSLLFRQAVHTILYAISSDDVLRLNMIMKGGMLLGIRYQSSRYTTDIDFSTSQTLHEIDQGAFEGHLANSLIIAADDLPYQVQCRLQSSKIQPRKNSDKASYPSFQIKIGYADASNKASMQRLLDGKSTNTIKIDYSLNEVSYELEELSFEGEESIHVYAISDLLAEKYRSIIQQVVRNRNRRQDVYDLWYLISSCPPFSNSEKITILQSLYKKSQGRIAPEQVVIDANTLDRDDIKSMSEQDYLLLSSEVSGEFPTFQEAYQSVNDFYKSLPWTEVVHG